jgi:hypothetical protein
MGPSIGRPCFSSKILEVHAMTTRLFRLSILLPGLAVAGFGLAGCPNMHLTLPIPMQLNGKAVPAFVGNPALASPVEAAAIPQNPHLAANDRSGTHNDAYMSDTYEVGGPLGKSPKVLTTFLGEDCATVGFDGAGRIVTIGIGPNNTRLWLLDPATLGPLCSLELPAKRYVPGAFPSGSYFVLDDEDRVVIPTIERTVWTVGIKDTPSGPEFEHERTYDLVDAVSDENDQIGSVVPDFSGRIWFVTDNGVVGHINQDTGVVAFTRLDGEGIGNSFAVDETGGVFIATDHAMYRFDAGDDGKPVVTWREEYDRGTRVKPGQHDQGTGTTPTLMGHDYVTIADNADPYMNVLVYRRARQVEGGRLVLKQPVFAADTGCTENSLIATDTSIIVENNYEYDSMLSTSRGRTTEPGIVRIDLDPQGGGHVAWTSQERVPSVISKLSLANGLVYSYCKDPGPGVTDAWYFVAIDFATGRTVYKQLAGTGLFYNNHYAGLYLGPDQTAYVGVLGGLVGIRDTE